MLPVFCFLFISAAWSKGLSAFTDSFWGKLLNRHPGLFVVFPSFYHFDLPCVAPLPLRTSTLMLVDSQIAAHTPIN